MHSRSRIWIGCWITLLFCTYAFCLPADDLRLIDAIKNGDRAAVRSLIEQRVNVNAAGADGATALAWAVNRNDTESVELLITAGANVNAATDYGVTPLSLACTNRNAGRAFIEGTRQSRCCFMDWRNTLASMRPHWRCRGSELALVPRRRSECQRDSAGTYGTHARCGRDARRCG